MATSPLLTIISVHFSYRDNAPHLRIMYIPRVIANRSPGTIEEYFHSSFSNVVTSHQSEVRDWRLAESVWEGGREGGREGGGEGGREGGGEGGRGGGRGGREHTCMYVHTITATLHHDTVYVLHHR